MRECKTKLSSGILARQYFIIISLLSCCILLSWSVEAAAWWARRYSGTGNWDGSYKSDFVNGIAVDGTGNVYVTGGSAGNLGAYSEDYATLKYDSRGNRLWVKRYNTWLMIGASSYSCSDVSKAIVVDKNDNVYVTGYVSYRVGSDPDYGTIKYDANGKQLWIRLYNREPYGEDLANAIAVDDGGNVYVTGYSNVSAATGGKDYATVKYDTNGKQLWAKGYNGPGNRVDEAVAAAVDGNGNVYVTGYSEGLNSSSDFATIKYGPNGNQLWVKRYNGPGNGNDKANAIALDNAGNVYVAGYSKGIIESRSYTLIKYSSKGNQLWVKRFTEAYEIKAMAVDKGGNVYVTGNGKGLYANVAYVTVKYDANGNRLWVKPYGVRGSGANAIAVDSEGNVFVTGYSLPPESSSVHGDYATIKYDTNGNELWVRRYNGLSSDDPDDFGMAIALDKNGNVFVTGQSQGVNSGYDYVTIKYDTNGN